jgi:hypothetical protein
VLLFLHSPLSRREKPPADELLHLVITRTVSLAFAAIAAFVIGLVFNRVGRSAAAATPRFSPLAPASLEPESSA